MSRRRKAIKRQIMPDPKFNDKIVSKFTSCLMYDGKRSTAEKIVYGAFEVIHKKIGTEPSYISKKVKTLECSKNGFNRPFPYNVSSSKPSFISCKDKPVQQIYNAHEYYGFSSDFNPDSFVFSGSIIANDEGGSIRANSEYELKSDMRYIFSNQGDLSMEFIAEQVLP